MAMEAIDRDGVDDNYEFIVENQGCALGGCIEVRVCIERVC